MTCDRCLIDHDGRPWIMADVYSGDVHAYCEACAVIVIDEYIALKKQSAERARNN